MERTKLAPIGREPIKLEREAVAQPGRPFERPLRERISMERPGPLGNITARIFATKREGSA